MTHDLINFFERQALCSCKYIPWFLLSSFKVTNFFKYFSLGIENYVLGINYIFINEYFSSFLTLFSNSPYAFNLMNDLIAHSESLQLFV